MWRDSTETKTVRRANPCLNSTVQLRTYDCARDVNDVWWMNMGGGIPADVLTEFERIVDQMGQQ